MPGGARGAGSHRSQGAACKWWRQWCRVAHVVTHETPEPHASWTQMKGLLSHGAQVPFHQRYSHYKYHGFAGASSRWTSPRRSVVLFPRSSLQGLGPLHREERAGHTGRSVMQRLDASPQTRTPLHLVCPLQTSCSKRSCCSKTHACPLQPSLLRVRYSQVHDGQTLSLRPLAGA